MNSLIFRVASYVVLPLALALSLYLLWRGHNAPGGGFVAGLIAAAGVASYALPRNAQALRGLLPLDPLHILAWGVLIATLAGVPAWFGAQASMTHAWGYVGTLHLGTTLLFDIGVYLAVMGSIIAFLEFFLEP